MDYVRRQPDEWSIEQVHHLIGEGDFVVVQAEGHQQKKPTMFYTIFRLSDGKIVEQWGVWQLIG